MTVRPNIIRRNMKNIWLSFLNIRTFKKMSIKTVLSLFAILFCILTFSECKTAVENFLLHLSREQASLSYVGFRDESDKNANLKNLEYKGYTVADPFISIDKMQLRIDDGTVYYGTETYDNYFSKDYYPFIPKEEFRVNVSITINDLDGCIFSKADFREFETKYPKEKYLLAGSTNTEDGDILLTDYLLQRFGVEKNEFENLIGKKIRIYQVAEENNKSKSLEDEIMFADLKAINDLFREAEGYVSYEGTLRGVVNSNIYHTEGNKSKGQIIIVKKTDENMFPKTLFQRIYYGQSFSETYHSYEQLINSGKKVYAKPVIEKYYEVEVLKNVMNQIVQVLIGAFALLFLCNLCIHLYFHNKRFQKNNAMLIVLGNTRNSVFTVVCLEYLVELLIAVVLAFWGAMVTRSIFADISRKMVGETLKADFGFVIGRLGLLSMGMLCILLLVAWSSTRHFSGKRSCELLGGRS